MPDAGSADHQLLERVRDALCSQQRHTSGCNVWVPTSRRHVVGVFEAERQCMGRCELKRKKCEVRLREIMRVYVAGDHTFLVPEVPDVCRTRAVSSGPFSCGFRMPERRRALMTGLGPWSEKRP
eukprot:2996613-Rhodomonas_salina.2